ncbi:MAG: branched-chain amino acid ABC transporter permease [Clostridia bacterium]|nr:branched-chain amino acid ABC transporter permease [Clostridia bacterium]
MSRYIANVKKQFKFKHITTWLLVAIALVILIILSNAGALDRSTTGLLSKIAYSIILATSLNLVVGFLGELSLGHAGFACLGAYIGTFAASYLRESIDSKLVVIILAMLIGGLVAAVFGLIIGLPALRLKGDYLAIVTLAFGEIVRNIFKNLPMFGGAMGYASKTYNQKELFIIAFVAVIIVLILMQNLIRSKHGRAITAIRDNEIAARAMGINVTFYKLFVFVIAAFFAGIAGVLYGHFTTPILYTKFDYNFSIEILVMVVLGGMGSINGSIISATLITIINFELQAKLSGDLAAVRTLVYAIILILIVVFNNAPALKPIKERFSLNHLKAKRNAKKAAVIHDDAAEWNRIETKVKMDTVLTPDLPHNEAVTPDKPDKPAKEDKENG